MILKNGEALVILPVMQSLIETELVISSVTTVLKECQEPQLHREAPDLAELNSLL
jgi:hypothetical protein